MKTQKLLLVIIVILFSACKTQEDIRREKTMDNINEKIAQTQQSTATTSTRFQNLEEQVAKLNGNVEEFIHNKSQDQKDNLTLKERFNAMEETNKKQNEAIKLLADKVNEQTKYIEQVVKSLSDLNDQKENEAKKKVEKNSSPSEQVKPDNSIKGAIASFKARQYEESKEIFEELLENSKMKKKDKAMALYYLGLIEFKAKKYEEAKIYFSRLFTEFPDSTMNSSALLNLAKCFNALKSPEEARQTLDELIARYPKSKEGIEGAKLKLKL